MVYKLVILVYKLFDRKFSGSGVKSEILPNQELAEDLQKKIIRKFEKRKVYSLYVDNIWGCNFVDMHLIS